MRNEDRYEDSFEKREARAKMKKRLIISGIGGATLAAIFGTAYIAADYVKDNEAAVRVNAGRVTDTDVDSGVHFDSLLPKVDYIKYPTTLQTVEVNATESDSFTIRTAEKARIYGAIKVKYRIDGDDPQFASIYELQKATHVSDIEDDIADYAIPAAIDTYKTIPAADINDGLTDIGKRIAERLEGILAEKGFSYIKIEDAVPTGMGLSPEANANLEQIVSEERKAKLIEAQAATAAAEAKVVEAQTNVTTEAFEQLRESGVPEDQLAQTYCLQLYRINGKIGEQFAASCISDANSTPVAVTYSNSGLNQGAPAIGGPQ